MSGSYTLPPGAIPAFQVLELSRSLNEVPPTPSLIGSLNLFGAQPMSVATATIERVRDRLALVPEQPRGAPANRNVMGQRDMLSLRVPHFPLSDTVMADSILGVRAPGQNAELLGWGQAVNQRLAAMGRHLDATLEHLRLGAIKGVIITSVDRETGAPLQSIDLYAQFNVVPQETIDFPMRGPGAQSMESAWNGRVMTASRLVARRIAAEIGGAPPGIACVCGANFFDSLLSAAETRSTFLNTPQAGALRDANLFTPFRYGNIAYYDAGMESVGAVTFVEPDAAYFFPVAVPDLFIECYAPAPYNETVNTLALPRYAKQMVLDFDKGIEIETQMNCLPVCTRPRTLIVGRLVDAP